MSSNKDFFKENDLFNSYAETKRKLAEYTASTYYTFSSKNSKTLKKLPNLPHDYNHQLIYDEKYYKCSVNPKTTTLNDFNKNNYGYVTIVCLINQLYIYN